MNENTDNRIKVNFYSGVGTATGANFLIEYKGTKILVDCGLIQGGRELEMKNFEPFAYEAKLVDYLLITHSHMDHIGRVPKLVKEGFKGEIISTEVSKELAEPALEDAFRVMKHKFAEQVAEGKAYEEEHIKTALSLWKSFDYYKDNKLTDNISFKFLDSGHILGSCIIEITFTDGDNKKKIAFTGDLGNSPSPLLRDNDFVTDSDYMIIESVYGDREHQTRDNRREELKQILVEGIEKGGTILIPSFSIERTQILLYEINNMVEDGEIESVPVYLDSPLASKVTEIYKKHIDLFNKEIQQEIKAGDDIFSFPKLKIIEDKRDSANIQNEKGPKIIMAGSGMSEGGRMMGHEINFLPDPKNTLVLSGYQGVGTLGRRLQDGEKHIKIMGKPVEVRASVKAVLGYSSHKDHNHLVEFVEKAAESGKLKKVFVCMGEPKSSMFLAQSIKENVGVEAIYPDTTKTYEL